MVGKKRGGTTVREERECERDCERDIWRERERQRCAREREKGGGRTKEEGSE